MVEYPGAENIALTRTHQELVRFPDSKDDTFTFISETIEEKLSGLLETETLEEGMGVPSQDSVNQRLLLLPPAPTTNTARFGLSEGQSSLEGMYDEVNK